jgi:arabinogalactan oligomer / maltooligosaccharide transport system permease protein
MTATVSSVPKQGLYRWFTRSGWRHVVGIVALIFALFPILWAISAAFNPKGGLSTQEVIPRNPSLQNFRTILNNPSQPYLTWMRNTVIVATIAGFCTVFLASLAAYAFSRLRFKGRRAGLLMLLLVQMFPTLLLVVAIYLMTLSIGKTFPVIGLGTKTGLIVVYLGGALGVNTWLLKGFFDTIPRELDESAVVDGASHAQIFFKIIFPLARPMLAVIFLLSFIASVNDLLVPNVLLAGDSDKFTLSVGLFNYVQGRSARFGPFAAGALLASIPVVALFGYLQKFLTGGLTQGAVKG